MVFAGILNKRIFAPVRGSPFPTINLKTLSMRKFFLALLCLLTVASVQAQYQTPNKYYPAYTKAGQVYVVYNYGEYKSEISSRIYAVDVPKENKYYISGLSNLQSGEKLNVYVDEIYYETIYATRDGWQTIGITSYGIILNPGKHIVKFSNTGGPHVPMVDEISLTTSVPATGRENDPNEAFLTHVENLKQQPAPYLPTVEEAGDLTNKVLPNPNGMYDHAIDTNFTYSHFSWIYLTAGYHNFSTANSTANRSLTIFNSQNYSYSWSNVNGGPGGESSLNLYVGLSGYYAIMLRPYVNGSGTSNIIYNGNVLVSGAVIGGRTYSMSAGKGGQLNFFTCRLTQGDTRMIASKYFASSARGYNDDYSGGGGDWNWGYASRIKKDFGTDTVSYGFVCAYSPSSTGISDVYLGNGNSPVYNTNYPEFPLLKSDDAILASNQGYYNCISWSGGVTATWIWPPSQYSTYNCPNNDMNLTCFDNFYANQPARYPGAWNFTRTGANVNNAIVDLWALNGHFTHGSVKKPGNNHPHGYDWESKPGGTPRTFHPRNALTNLNWGYGAVVNYYIPTGTYARGADAGLSFETDADAVKAGVAVFDIATLTGEAQRKLSSFKKKVDPSFSEQFNKLYEAWKKTWAANAIYSDPSAYCKNPEFEKLAQFSRANSRSAMFLSMDKFTGGDHLIGELLWTLTKDRYSALLTEVKTERLTKPNDEQGRYRIHGDHDNGVLYVEKILRSMDVEQEVVVNADINVIVSPNPASDRLTVQVITTKTAKVSVNITSAQTRLTKVMQQETTLTAGTHRFTTSIQGLAGNSGDIIAVQVIVDGVLKTVKVLVAK